MRIIKSIVTVSILLMAVSSHAGQLAGKNLLLIQGFLPQHVFAPPSDQGLGDGVDYWSSFKLNNNGNGGNSDPHAKILYFASSSKIEEDSSSGKLGSGINVINQLKDIFNSNPGYCNGGCVVVTHSTGDLVMRWVMENRHLLGNHEDKLDVVAFVDMAGAGGGTEGAVWLNAVASGANVPGAIVEGLSAWLGGDLSVPELLHPGILHDLQPGVARTTAVNDIPAIPRLRIASAGTELYGALTHLFIKGKDDSVVPLHSSCGAANDGAYDSCATDLRIDGRVKNGVNGPTAYYDYHYPIIMSEKMPHNDQFKALGWDYSSGYPWYVDGRDMTLVLSGVSDYANSDADKTLGVDADYYEIYAWWDWFRKYRYIRDADEKSMGEVIAESFN